MAEKSNIEILAEAINQVTEDDGNPVGGAGYLADVLVTALNKTKLNIAPAVPPIPQEPTNPYDKTVPKPVHHHGQVQYLDKMNPDYLRWQEGHDATAAAYRPLLEQAEQRVEELEKSHKHSIAFSHENIVLLENAGWVHENDLKKNGWINRKQHTRSIHEHLAAAAEDSEEAMASLEAENARLTEQLHDVVDTHRKSQIAALESQLKPVSGWEETLLTDAQMDDILDKEDGHIFQDTNNQKISKAQAELTWRKAKQGMVELDENQTVPRNSMIDPIKWDGYCAAQQDMLNAGFRKVKLGKGETK